MECILNLASSVGSDVKESSFQWAKAYMYQKSIASIIPFFVWEYSAHVFTNKLLVYVCCTLNYFFGNLNFTDGY